MAKAFDPGLVIPARISRDNQRWLCGNRACPGTLATRERDDKGAYLLLPEAFDLHDSEKYYYRSRRPARRFNKMQLKSGEQSLPIQDAMKLIQTSRNTDVQLKLRPSDLPAVVCCARCGVFSIIKSVAAQPA